MRTPTTSSSSWTGNGSIRYASPSFERTYGFSLDEVNGTDAFELVHPDDRENGGEDLPDGLTQEGHTVTATYRVMHKDGSWHWVEVKGKNLLADPAVAGVVINSTDITERREYEEALRASEKKLRFVTDNMMDMVSQVSREGKYEFIGLSHREHLGYEPREMLGRTVFEFVHPDDLEYIVDRYLKGIEERVSLKVDYRYRHADGRYLWMESIANPIFDDEGKEITGAIIGTRDITERKRTEERLARLNGCFLSLGADFRDNIEVLVASGREILDGVLLVYYRPSDDKLANAFAAWSEDGLYISGLVRERLMKEVGARGAGRPYIVEGIEGSEYEALMPDLARFGIKRLMACAVMLKDRLTGFLCLLDREEEVFTREETEIMGMLARSISIEEERWAYEEALRDFINITSHELRHPITLMKGYSEVLNSFGEDLDEETRRKALNAIDRGTIRLEKLVSALLDTSRIERGSFLVQRKDVELVRLIEEVVEEMLIKGSPHYFELELPDPPLVCGADPEKLTQLLVILLENAVKYAPAGSAITVEAREENETVIVSVTDRGPGVPVEERKRIFDRLYQVGDAIYHSVPGIGLGLYIARKIVEAHGGLIWYEPNPEGGSIFSFLLP